MADIIVLLGWLILIVAVLFTVSTILEITSKRETYEILTKICLGLLPIIGVIIGILGLLAK